MEGSLKRLKYRRKSAVVRGRPKPKFRAVRGPLRRPVRRARAQNLATVGYLGMELKYSDRSVVDRVVATSTDCSGFMVDPTTFNCISVVAQGDEPFERDGRKIQIKSIQLEGWLEMPRTQSNSNPGETFSVRVALVMDTQTNGAQMLSENVWVNPSANSNNAPFPLRNLLFNSRFKVIKEWDFQIYPKNLVLVSTGIFGWSSNSYRFSCYKKCEIPVLFSGAGAAIGNVVDNSLHVLAGTNVSGGSVTISYNSRIRYVG